jgi:hypothetical protein
MELFIQDIKSGKFTIFQYPDSEMYSTMLPRFRKWESEGKLHIIDIRKITTQ